MGIGLVLSVLALIAVALGVVALVRRISGRSSRPAGDGSDVIAYGLLAVAVAAAGFSLSALARAAFPGDRFLFGSPEQVAGSLAALVVSGPIAVFLWRRQSRRRQDYPESGGWTFYLVLVEAAFVISLVIALVELVAWVLGEPEMSAWTDVVVFGGIVVFHELASRSTPPRSEASEAPRVVGSAIGLITLAIGLGGLLDWLFSQVYEAMTARALFEPLGVETSIAAVVVGAALWWYRWLRAWEPEPGTPRNLWTSLMSIGGLITAVGASTLIVGQTLVYLVFSSAPAGTHFEFLPAALSAGLVGGGVWAHHLSRLGQERTDAVRAYQYAMAAAGLGTAVGSATSLAGIAFGPARLVGRPSDDALMVAVILVAALIVWYRFWSRCSKAVREEEAGSSPRRVYLLGMGVIAGLTSAGALIATLVVVFQWLLGAEVTNVASQTALFSLSGIAAWHLLRVNAVDRAMLASQEVITPFAVTVICSDPGPLASLFPAVAEMSVIYRGDDSAVISEEMASAIVEAVANSPSLVWVDEDGFRVAPAG